MYLVQGGMNQYVPVCTLVDTRRCQNRKVVHTGMYYIPVCHCTGVGEVEGGRLSEVAVGALFLHCTRWYKAVQHSTRRYTAVQET